MSHSAYILPSNVPYIPQAPFLTLIVLAHWPAITIPHNIIQKFPAQFFGTDTSTAIDQCGILFIPIRPATTSPYQYHRPSQLSHSLALPTL